MNKGRKIATFSGLSFVPLTTEDLSKVIAEGEPDKGVSYHFVNAFSIVCARESKLVHQALSNGALICDGKPLNHILKKSGAVFCYSRGVDFMRLILQDRNSKSKHYFLGSTQDVLQEMIVNAKALNSDLQVVGAYAPPFRQDFSDFATELGARISESKATCVWIGLGTPKQDLLSSELARILNAHIFAVGAAFDFLSKRKLEAPKLFQKLGLEWLIRLLLEPRRLGKRYLVGNVIFLKIAIQHLLKREGV
jgi:N-acetylglucosaminyldiphosphoundecaprenol N-acetyl-beta-D-mannosaminyltransferase